MKERNIALELQTQAFIKFGLAKRMRGEPEVSLIMKNFIIFKNALDKYNFKIFKTKSLIYKINELFLSN